MGYYFLKHKKCNYKFSTIASSYVGVVVDIADVVLAKSLNTRKGVRVVVKVLTLATANSAATIFSCLKGSNFSILSHILGNGEGEIPIMP